MRASLDRRAPRGRVGRQRHGAVALVEIGAVLAPSPRLSAGIDGTRSASAVSHASRGSARRAARRARRVLCWLRTIRMARAAGNPRTCSTLASSTKSRFPAEGGLSPSPDSAYCSILCAVRRVRQGGSGKEAEHVKVAVIGYASSGKSTFARRLGDALCIPVQHLDQVFYTSNWQERDKGEARNLAEAFLDVNDAWVVDGTYHRLALARRLEAADVIVSSLPASHLPASSVAPLPPLCASRSPRYG